MCLVLSRKWIWLRINWEWKKERPKPTTWKRCNYDARHFMSIHFFPLFLCLFCHFSSFDYYFCFISFISVHFFLLLFLVLFIFILLSIIYTVFLFIELSHQFKWWKIGCVSQFAIPKTVFELKVYAKKKTKEKTNREWRERILPLRTLTFKNKACFVSIFHWNLVT